MVLLANKFRCLVRFHRNTNVRDYIMTPQFDDDSPEWLYKREIPSSLEIKGEDENATIEEEIEIEVNRVHAAWESKAKYLETHYRLLREDAVTPLRNAVAEVREDPHILEKDSFEDAAIYEKVLHLGPNAITHLLLTCGRSILSGLLLPMPALLPESHSQRGELARRSFGISQSAY